MPDYTEANAIKKITTGDEAGTWGASTNNNFDIIDRASNGYSKSLNIQGLSGSGTATAPYELPQSTTAVLSDGHYKVIRFTSAGSLSSSTYLRLARNDKARMYMFVNATTGSQSIIVSQSDAGDISSATNVTIANGKSAIVLADGAGGSSSTVIDFSALIGGISELDVTAGTVTASKAVVVDSNKDITGFRNVTIAEVSGSGGQLVAKSLDISGDADIDGTLEADAITGNGTALSSVIAGTTVTNATNATNATQLANARTIGGVSFNGTANIDLPGVNTAGTQDTSGNAASATTAAALTGDVTKSGDFTVDATADIILDADGQQIRFKDDGSEKFTFFLDSTPQMNVDGAFEIQSTGDITLNAIGDQIIFADSGTARFTFNLDGSPEIDVSSTLELDVTDYIIFKDEGTERFRLDYSTSNETRLLAKGTTQSLLLQGSATGEDQRVIIPSDSDYPALQIGYPSSTSLQGSSLSATLIHKYYFAKNSYNSNPQAPSSVTCQRTDTSSTGGIGATLILFPDHTNSSSDCFQLWSDTAPTSSTKSFNKAFSVTPSGNVTIDGALSKGSGSFKIDHPLSSKSNTHYLVHSFLEGPQADLIYRGKVALTGGSATVNIDTAAGMSEGTFALLCRDVQCFTSNETGWTAIKGSVSGNTLTITAQDNSCTDTISWMVVGERKDQHMIDTDWTDETGKVIVEPKKVIEE